MNNLKNELHHIPCLPGCGEFGRISTCPVCLLKAEWQILKDERADLLRLGKHHYDLWINFAETCKGLTATNKILRTQNAELQADCNLIDKLTTQRDLLHSALDRANNVSEVWRTAYEGLRARLLTIRGIVSEEN